jgi:hypothetical protein
VSAVELRVEKEGDDLALTEAPEAFYQSPNDIADLVL